MKWLLIFLAILMVPFISALCGESQIDINSASLEELDKIKWVGPPTAQKIIDARPFNSVDDLTKVSGIGEIKLAAIKEESLACVSEEKELKTQEEVFEDIVEEVKEEIIEEVVEEINEPVDLKIIELNPKVIKTGDPEESYNLYAILGLVTFSVLLALLFLLKKLKGDKNEFD